MKVLFINSVCGIGSTGRICIKLAQGLEEQGHECRIAYGRKTVPDMYRKFGIRIGKKINVILHVLRTRICDEHGFCSKHATSEFLKWADQFNPDLLWLHNIHGYYINIEMLFRWIKRRPQMQVRWTLHDCWAFTGHCSYFTVDKCDQWKNHCLHCPQIRRYPASLLISNCEQNFERKQVAFTGVMRMILITPSQWLAGLVKQSFLMEYQTEVLHNNVDTSVFKPTPSDFRQRYGLEGKKIILGVANVWNERKGIDDFFKLAKSLDDNFRIVMVGLNSLQIRSLLPNMIGIQKTNSARELAEIYSAADVFFNPTYEDNYPTVNIEAEACGTKVITYCTGGAPETIRREDSLVVPVGYYRWISENE